MIYLNEKSLKCLRDMFAWLYHDNSELSLSLPERATENMAQYLHLLFKYKYFWEAIHETKWDQRFGTCTRYCTATVFS